MTAQEPTPPGGPAPMFLFSLPRSGSTLLQRILATHPEIATAPEPTFLLPMIHMRSSTDVFSTFDQRFAAMAIKDFLASTGDGVDTFDAMVRAAANEAYSRSAGGQARYFLDKTPRYHMVAQDILRIFPDAPAVVLWRNPLAVIASIMSTWHEGRWNLQHFRLDLFRALPKLIDLVSENPERVQAIRYEDLVADSGGIAGSLFERLGLDPAQSDIERFSEVELVGRIQDPNAGTEGFTSVRSDRVDQWTEILSNPIRKRWCRRYLRWLGAERMTAMGYDLEDTLRELDDIATTRRFLASDMLLVPFDTVYRVCELYVFGSKLAAFRKGERPVLAHK